METRQESSTTREGRAACKQPKTKPRWEEVYLQREGEEGCWESPMPEHGGAHGLRQELDQGTGNPGGLGPGKEIQKLTAKGGGVSSERPTTWLVLGAGGQGLLTDEGEGGTLDKPSSTSSGSVPHTRGQQPCRQPCPQPNPHPFNLWWIQPLVLTASCYLYLTYSLLLFHMGFIPQELPDVKSKNKVKRRTICVNRWDVCRVEWQKNFKKWYKNILLMGSWADQLSKLAFLCSNND